jgi:cholesterol transport system auxiliary component
MNMPTIAAAIETRSASLPRAARLRGAALALLALALSSCSILPDRREELAIWRIDAVPAAAPGAPVAWQLAVDEPVAPPPLDGARIVLAPGGGEFGVYRGARWGERAPRMLQDLLLRALADSGRIAGLGRGTDGVRADYRLLVDLRAFHVEADADRARIALSARLLRWPEGTVVAQRAFEAQAPLQDRGIAGVVAAFEAASAEVVPALGEWALGAGEADSASR